MPTYHWKDPGLHVAHLASDGDIGTVLADMDGSQLLRADGSPAQIGDWAVHVGPPVVWAVLTPDEFAEQIEVKESDD